MLLLLATIPLMIIGVAIAVVPLVVTLVREPRADRPTPAQIDLAAAEVRTEDERLHDDLLRAATEAATRRDHHERVLVNA